MYNTGLISSLDAYPVCQLCFAETITHQDHVAGQEPVYSNHSSHTSADPAWAGAAGCAISAVGSLA